jgi:hypothetical protein
VANGLKLAQTLVDNDELRDVIVADVNAWLGLGPPTASVEAPGKLSPDAKESLA